ncbi:MAG: hypothetical protein NTW14_08985 [bacterium]|nr:hypothetical protein [bacterium]
MGTVNQELLGNLQQKLGVGKTQVYWHIARRREETRLSRDLSAIALALETGLDVSRYATEHDLEIILHSSPILAPQIEKILPQKREVSRAIQELNQQESSSSPFVDSKTIHAAYRNAELYAKFYLFENSLRMLVHAIMEKKYGAEWWYETAPRDIMNATFERRSGEKEPRWRGQWGAEPIYYTDIKDLSVIMETHQDLFSRYLGENIKIDGIIDLIERIRTSFAFTNPVAQKDREQFTAFLDQWNTLLDQAHHRMS